MRNSRASLSKRMLDRERARPSRPHFAIHAGVGRIVPTGSEVHLDARSLAILYVLPTATWIPWPTENDAQPQFGPDPTQFVHLYPRADGVYVCPLADSARAAHPLARRPR